MKLLKKLTDHAKVVNNEILLPGLKGIKEECVSTIGKRGDCMWCRYWMGSNFSCQVYEKLYYMFGRDRVKLPMHWELPENTTSGTLPKDLGFLENVKWSKTGQPILGGSNETVK